MFFSFISTNIYNNYLHIDIFSLIEADSKSFRRMFFADSVGLTSSRLASWNVPWNAPPECALQAALRRDLSPTVSGGSSRKSNEKDCHYLLLLTGVHHTPE